ncbi:PKD-like family lipoprotein [Duncaniella freteri]|uniref:PKD-like family lipoprotein n=1 Tax=Duncaniella freteri TaxID=2530391 RepID=UPI002554A4D6|nr:PKD-like family lipoprotein [Duncaniella freteri]
MKTKKYILLCALGCILPACVEDEGTYTYTPVNEVSIDGVEETYTGMAYSDVIEIKPEITGSVNGDDLSNYEYTWYRCRGSHVHDTISHEKDLIWKANAAPGNHTFYLSVKDKVTGYEKNTHTQIQLSSPFTRGFLILGNRPHTDNLVGLDMLSMITGRKDTIYAKDVFDNSEIKLRNAKALFLTSNSRQNRLYLQTEDATYNPKFTSEFETLGDEFNDLGLIECLDPHKVPMKLMDVAMKPGVHRPSSLTTQPRAYLTEDQAFAHKATEKMTQPVNRYSSTSTIYFKFYPYIFYNTRKSSINIPPTSYGHSTTSPIVLYDTDNDCFSYYYGNALVFTHTVPMSNTPLLQQTGIYLTNQPNGRTIVYGENDYFSGNGRCNIIMKDNDDDYFLYRFVLDFPSMGYMPAPRASSPFFTKLNISSMTNFLNREHILFASGATSLIYYSVGNTLYAYDYVSNKLESKQFDGNITYLAPEVCSLNNVSHYWVATFDGDKGHLYKMQTIDNPNKIEFTHLPNQDWEIDLEIKSVLWKSSSIY